MKSWKIALCASLAAALPSLLLFAQPPANWKQDAPRAKPDIPRIVFGSIACQDCHTFPYKPNSIQGAIRCDGDEYTRWEREDKHQNAFRILQGDLGKRMATALGYDVTKHAGCLSCHGAAPSENPDETYLKAREAEGVTCMMCHGPHEEWIKPHGWKIGKDRKAWLEIGRVEKERQFGMTDLWNPVRRSEVCLSCHLGNGKDKFVSHDMYAAGHPPLSAVEMGAFSNSLPPHWNPLKVKKSKMPEVFQHPDFANAQVDTEFSELTLVGSVVAFRESMHQLSAQSQDDQSHILDFANFDCYSCHHELRPKSWRLDKQSPGRRGRPGMRPWPTALLDLAIDHVRAKDPEKAKAFRQELTQGLAALNDAYTIRPLGDRAKIAPAADHLAKWSRRLIDEIANIPIDKVAGERLLRTALQMGSTGEQWNDFDSARMLSWATLTLQSECGESLAGKASFQPLKTQLEQELQLLFAPKKQTISDSFDMQPSYVTKSLQRQAQFELNPERFREAYAKLLADWTPKK